MSGIMRFSEKIMRKHAKRRPNNITEYMYTVTRNVILNHHRKNYYIHTFAAKKYVCNYPALIVIISLKTPSLPFLLTINDVLYILWE